MNTSTDIEASEQLQSAILNSYDDNCAVVVKKPVRTPLSGMTHSQD